VISLEESETDRIYLDATQSIEKRVEDLIGRMTIEEKVAQLGSQWAVELLEGRRWSLEKLKKKLNHGIGQITRIGGGLDFSPEEVAIKANEIQNFLINETRLGIPAIIHEECLSGLSAKDATYFPQIIGIASTWEPELVKKMTTIIRNQMKVVGADQALSPVLDIARDPRWGRTEECFGEDPYLVARMGIAYIHGLQGDSLETGILATGKHFVGYGSSMGGRNWGPSFIPQRELLEVYAKPFEAAIKEASLGSIMNAYHEIDGLPCGFSHYFLTELLRNKLGFNGMVVSDYFTVKLNSRMHQIASSPTKAGILAIRNLN
jgi:beta-glucosidase